MTKLCKLIATIACIFCCALQAQFSSQQAINLVLNNILTTELDHIDVFMLDDAKSGQSTIALANDQLVSLPYSSNWVFFVDDNPFANWAHSCRFVFLNTVTGEYQISNQKLYPVDWQTDYSVISEMIRPIPLDLPVNNDPVLNEIDPNPNLFAVIIGGNEDYENDRFWNDISAIYCTLIDYYGYTKENIFVHYDYGSSSNYGNDLDGPLSPSNDIDFDSYKASIKETFEEMSGLSIINDDIPKLEADDQLFIFITCHGDVESGMSYILIPGDDLYDLELAGYLKDINCAQMIIVMEQCFAGGFYIELSDYTNYNVSCKNRSIQTASNEEPSLSESWITGNNYNEFTYYWTAAVRGKYSHNIYPWEESYETGSFPFQQQYPQLEGHPGDYNPDLNDDEVIQMEEAFLYANAMDTWTDDGYYYFPIEPGLEEFPQNFIDISFNFNDYLLTLQGLSGHVTNTQIVECRNYMIGGDFTIDPGITLTLSNGTGIYHGTEIADIFIKSNASLVIGNTSSFNNINNYYTEIFVDGSMIINDYVSFNSSGGYYKTYVDGQIQIGSHVSFLGEDGGQLWLRINNTSLNVTIDQAELLHTAIISFNNQLNVSNSTLTNSGIFGFNGDFDIKNSQFNTSFVDIKNANTNNRLIKIWDNCEFGGLTIKSAITIDNYPNYIIDDCHISFCSEGIGLYNSGYGKKEHLIKNCDIVRNSNAAIKAYRSFADIIDNYIYINGYGIMSYDISSVHIQGSNLSVTQEIRDNTSYEIYASRLSFPQYLHWNLIQDDDNKLGDPLVKYAGTDGYFDVRNNCWGTSGCFNPLVDLEPVGHYIWDPQWLCNNGSGSGSSLGAEALYLNARESIEAEDYASAKTDFEQIVDEYPETEFAKAAMKELYSIEEYTNNNYSTLKEYFAENSVIQGDSSLAKLANFLANFCEIKLENWPTAISWFENVIENPEMLEDSIFAIIDMGYTYWLMENGGLKSTYTGKMGQYKFSSREEFEDNRDFLLSLLPGDQLSETMKQSISTLKSGELLQNVPNPFNGTTQIWFKLAEESSVSVTIYDYTGKEVSVINPGSLKSGNHSVEFNSSNLSSGIYFYSLEVNGIKTDTKKMTLMK